jgi:ABC-type multidrug transport system fused ATPase/permease subunit
MNSIVILFIAFAGVFGATLLGMFLRAVLPEQHLSADSKDAVRLGIGVIATMAALVLGLLVTSAKSFFDSQSSTKINSIPKWNLERAVATFSMIKFRRCPRKTKRNAHSKPRRQAWPLISENCVG